MPEPLRCQNLFGFLDERARGPFDLRNVSRQRLRIAAMACEIESDGDEAIAGECVGERVHQRFGAREAVSDDDGRNPPDARFTVNRCRNVTDGNAFRFHAGTGRTKVDESDGDGQRSQQRESDGGDAKLHRPVQSCFVDRGSSSGAGFRPYGSTSAQTCAGTMWRTRRGMARRR